MAAPLDSSPNTIFQFVALRDPQKYPTIALDRRFIRFDWGLIPRQGNVRTNIAAQPVELIAVLADLKRKDQDALKNMIARVKNFETTAGSGFIGFVLQLRINYPDFSKLYEWILPKQRNDATVTLATFQGELQKALGGTTVANYVGAANFRQDQLALWENFIAQIIMPTDRALPQELTNIIRMNWIAGRINNGDLQLQNMQDIYEAVRATILLPTEIFPLPQPVAPVPLYRLSKNDHLFTTSAQERDNAVALYGYKAEGIACNVYNYQVAGTVPLFRLSRNDHFYTTSAPERNNAINTFGYTDEGIACYVFDTQVPGTIPLYRLRNNVEHFYTTSIAESHNVISDLNYAPEGIACYVPENATHWPGTKGSVEPCFIADFKAVQTQLLLYAKGEIAQIANLMAGEENTHVVRNFDRNEQVIMRDVETTTTTERESQITDKNELSQEATQVLKEDMKLDVGVNLSANFGSVSIQTKTGFSYQNSRENTNKVASKLSRDVMNRALTRITERIRQQTTLTTIHETEDTNTHVLKNAGATPTSVIYRWVDKYYLAKLISYGPRTIIDVVIPEPAAFYIHTQTHKKPATGIVVEKPTPPWGIQKDPSLLPKTGLRSFQDILLGAPGNWERWVAVFDVQNVQPVPANSVTVNASLAHTATSDEGEFPDGRFAETYEKLMIPDGYIASNVRITSTAFVGAGIKWTDAVKNLSFVEGQVGNVQFTLDQANLGNANINLPMNGEAKGILPISVRSLSRQYAINIEVDCTRTPESLDTWRINTFNAIMAGYKTKQQAYESWLRTQNNNGSEINTIKGKNPAVNREIEKEELKKSCLELLTAQRFESFDAMTSDPSNSIPPEFDFSQAMAEGRYSRFFEDSFEWPLLSYIFYPYFWGRKNNWVDIKQNEDTDPLFTKFLHAGAARVIVPIRPGFEGAISHYLCTGMIWGTDNGGDVPTVDSELYVSIADEMKEAAGHFDNEKIVDQWTVKVPTSFVIIDDPGNPAVLPDNSADPELLGHKATLKDLG